MTTAYRCRSQNISQQTRSLMPGLRYEPSFTNMSGTGGSSSGEAPILSVSGQRLVEPGKQVSSLLESHPVS